MSQGLRQSVSGLHTWAGLVFGWVLMAIFVGGTFSVFAEPISYWTAGIPKPVLRGETIADSLNGVEIGVRHLERAAPDARKFQLYLPMDYVGWTDAAGQEHEATLDPRTGRERGAADPATLPRETAGGGFFVGLHYSLHAGMAGILLVGFVTVALLVALVSGIIIHKRIFKDFFTLRLGKGQRSWLDGHNVASVLTLPFQLMIAYTGLCIFLAVWMPSSVLYHYAMPEGLQGELDWTSPYVKARTTEGFARARPMGNDFSLAAIPVLAAEASRQAGKPLSEVLWTEEKRLIFIAGDAPWLEASGSPARFYPYHRTPDAADKVQEVMIGLHELHYGGQTARWLWFFSSIAGCLMIATGLILFTQKRRQRSGEEFGAATPTIYRLIGAMNVASVAGILVASAAFFWANRLLSTGLPDRAAWEVKAFLLVWALSLAHALVRRERAARIEQIGLTALLCLALPILNAATTGLWFGSYARTGQWESFGVEIGALVLGLALSLTALRLARRAA